MNVTRSDSGGEAWHVPDGPLSRYPRKRTYGWIGVMITKHTRKKSIIGCWCLVRGNTWMQCLRRWTLYMLRSISCPAGWEQKHGWAISFDWCRKSLVRCLHICTTKWWWGHVPSTKLTLKHPINLTRKIPSTKKLLILLKCRSSKSNRIRYSYDPFPKKKPAKVNDLPWNTDVKFLKSSNSLSHLYCVQ